MTTVVDASVVFALLTDEGDDGVWAQSVTRGSHAIAPQLLPAEVANALRRAVRLGTLTPDVATLAHYDLADLALELFPYEPFGERVWALRENLTAYDAWYVALAEALEAPLATLDDRLVRSPGPRCEFLTPAA